MPRALDDPYHEAKGQRASFPIFVIRDYNPASLERKYEFALVGLPPLLFLCQRLQLRRCALGATGFFEQRGLRARPGAVDLVGQHDLRHDRAWAELELAGLLVEHVHARDVGGQEVGRELEALERAAERAGE